MPDTGPEAMIDDAQSACWRQQPRYSSCPSAAGEETVSCKASAAGPEHLQAGALVSWQAWKYMVMQQLMARLKQ